PPWSTLRRPAAGSVRRRPSRAYGRYPLNDHTCPFPLPVPTPFPTPFPFPFPVPSPKDRRAFVEASRNRRFSREFWGCLESFLMRSGIGKKVYQFADDATQ